jgi:folate-binding protein YgfZ
MDLDRLTADYRALSTAVGVVDLTALRSRVEVRGADRVGFVHNFCTNDIKALPDGETCEAFLLNGKGNVLFYAEIRKRPESIVIESGADRGAAIIRHLDKYVIREDVTFADRSSEWSELLVVGPQAATHVGDVGGTLIVHAGNWTAMPNFVVLGPAAEVQELQQRLVAAGVPLCSYAALDALRIEAGFPLDGVDVGDKNLAQEVDRVAQTISFKKGCYLGQETVARLDALGHVNKSLVGLRFADRNAEQVPPRGTELIAGGRVVGEVASSAYSPGAVTSVALAYVRTGSNVVGTRLDSACGTAEVVAFQRNS